MKKREALTQARSKAPIVTFGDVALAKALKRALDVWDTPIPAARGYTHGFHSYPARMHALTARRSLEALGLSADARAAVEQRAERPLVLDPFCGSGTVLVEALRVGARAVGVDASPLAGRIARAKTWAATTERRRVFVERAGRIANAVLLEGKAARRSGFVPPTRERRPIEDDPKLKELFDPHVRRELEALAANIALEKDEELRNHLLIVLSSILTKVSKRESDSSAKAVARKIGRGMSARLFVRRAEELATGLGALAKEAGGILEARVTLGDARELEAAKIGDASVDAIVTSPPYAGTYDYLEHHTPRLAFLGLPIEGLARREIGSRRGFAGGPEIVQEALARWDRDLGKVLREMARVLKPGACAAVLIGDSLAGRSVAVFADDVLKKLAVGAGLNVIAGAGQARMLLGQNEQRVFALRPKREHLIVLEKPRA